MSPRQTPKRDLHAEVTQALIAAIEKDPGQPVMPWRRTGGAPLWLPENALTKNRYNGINVVSLWVATEAKGFSTPIWATYKQWAQLGAQVRGGEKASLVVFYKEFTGEPNPDDEKDDGTRRVARASYVFNAAQIDGYTVGEPPEPLGPVARIEAADRFLTQTGARIEAGGERAYYRPSTDTIHMPDEGLFTGTDTMNRSEAWYATALHETTHWSGAKPRLNRDFGKRFGDQAYVAEELVAEIASAFLCAELSITQDVRADHAQYLAHWLTLLKADDRAIFTAAAKASEAVNYLKGLQAPAPEPEPPDGPRRTNGPGGAQLG
jgi:antirestriction protein ArdC